MVAVPPDDLPSIPPELRARAARWAELKRWERRELGQALRALGLSYREIGEIVPVPRGTLSEWCRDLVLPDEHRARLSEKRPALAVRRAVGARARARALARHHAERESAHVSASGSLNDARWMAGVVAYWAEGAKRSSGWESSNSDPDLVRLFVNWARRYLDVKPGQVAVQLHLHAGQDEDERKRFWSKVIGVSVGQFQRTFIKPEGTGHRKNILYNGTVKIRVRRSKLLLFRVHGWIDAIRDPIAP